jgi:hypothetical protein
MIRKPGRRAALVLLAAMSAMLAAACSVIADANTEAPVAAHHADR